MRSDIETYELIERYLNNELSPNELSAFNIELQTNPELASELNVQQMIQSVTVDSHLATIKEKTNAYNPYYNAPSKVSRYRNIALALITLLGSASIIYYVSQMVDKSKGNITNTITFEANDTIQNINKTIDNRKNSQKLTNPSDTRTNNNYSKNPSESFIKTQKTDDKYLILNRKSKQIREGDETTIKHTNTYKNTHTEKASKKTKAVFITNTNETIRSKEDTINVNQKFVKDMKDIELESPCHNINLKVKLHAVPSCTGRDNGRIEIRKIQGGVAPYLTKVDNYSFGSENSFENLKAGEHSLYIKDSEGCGHRYNVNILSEDCFKVFPINPSKQHFWKYQLSSIGNYSVTIYDANENAVYQTSIQNKDLIEWKGKSQQGENLKKGKYLFIIKHNEKEYEKGYIKIK